MWETYYDVIGMAAGILRAIYNNKQIEPAYYVAVMQAMEAIHTKDYERCESMGKLAKILAECNISLD